MNPPLVLLDAASLYFRSFYALPESLLSPDGVPINAVRGFADTLVRILTERAPGRLVACLDADWRPAFRVAALPSYKAHRVAEDTGDTDGDAEAVPDTLTPQVPIILELLEAAGIATAEAAGYEADDVIATLCAAERDDPVEVITGDRDLFQLVREEPTPVRVIYLGKGWAKAEILGPAEIAARYGLPVGNAGRAYADMATLRGDPSDGLPGVPGVGEKTAAKLITQFGSLEALLDAASGTSLPTKTAAKLAGSADYLRVAPTVVRTATDAPLTRSRDDHLDRERLSGLIERWGLRSSGTRLLTALAG